MAGSGAQAQIAVAGLVFEKDVAIAASDGLQLRANVFRPEGAGKFPVIISMSPYGKDIHFQDYLPSGWAELTRLVPDVCKGSTCQFMNWETIDPERWTPRGYVVIRVDSRGSGKSPGYLDPYSPRETQDFYDAIEWAAQQPWSNGKVGIVGISYYATTQWQVAALRPPHLAAILPWEGLTDVYRDSTHQGGIYGDAYLNLWWVNVLRNQHGNPEGFKDRFTSEPSNGPALSDDLLAGSRAEYPRVVGEHPLDDAWMRQRTPDLSRITVPVLSAGNWGGLARHLRGNIEGYMGVASSQKWLSIHTGTHFDTFYKPEWTAVQMRFFDHFLKGADNGWDGEPPVQVAIRRPTSTTYRAEAAWPLPQTRWTRLHLGAASHDLSSKPPSADAQVTFDARGTGVAFNYTARREDLEFTGPLSARLWVSSTTTDADLFLTLRAFGPDGQEVTFAGANDPAAPITQGWLRLSHRRLDPLRSTPWRPWRNHQVVDKLQPGVVYPVDVEIWPTSFVLPKGYRLSFQIEGHDFERAAGRTGVGPGVVSFRGSGPFLHRRSNDAIGEFAGKTTLFTGPGRESYILLPVIPPSRAAR
ncbi:MAG: CocE/NonD family hydrolase [Phenylobacterium sp.]